MTNLRKEAKDQLCMVRIPEVCNGDSTTTILHHIRINTGMGQKPPDLLGTWCCSNCHAAIHGQIKTAYTREELRLFEYEGGFRTIGENIRKGLVTW